MSSTGAPPKLLNHTENVIDLADALSAILVVKLIDALRDTIALEAKRWRTDALHILPEVRKDIGCRFDGSGTTRDDDPPITPPDDDARHTSHLSENSSNSSGLSLPLTSLRRTTSLEQRLAVGIFTATYAERKSSKESKEQTRKGKNFGGKDDSSRERSASFHENRKQSNFHPVVPMELANTDRLPGEVLVGDCKDTPTPQTRQPSEKVHLQASSSCSRTYNETVSPTNCLSFPSSTLERVSSLNSHDTEASVRNRIRPDDSVGVASLSSHRSLCSTTSSTGVTRWKHAARRFYDERSPSVKDARGVARRIIPNVFKALGIIPWSRDRMMLSKLYQFAVFCCLLVSTLNMMTRSFVGYSHELSEHAFALHVDDVLALGTFLGFSVALWKNEALHDSNWLIESYLSRAGRLEDAYKQSSLQLAIMLLIWSLCVGSRLYANALALSLIDLSFAFNIIVLLALCFLLDRICYCLSVIVDNFCCYMQDNSDCEKALEEFFLLHCTVRTACASLQSCFVILQLTATVILLLCSASIYFGATHTEWVVDKLLPGLLCQVALLQLSVRASLVSDMCARVPMLVNSANAKLSQERMYVIEYIVHCQTGFYIFEVKLNTATLLKLFYIAFVAWCGLLTQGWGMRA